jgi:hypothetical protein
MKNKFGSKHVGETEADDLQKKERMFSKRKDCVQKKEVKAARVRRLREM